MSPQHHVIIGDGATAAAFASSLKLDRGSRLSIIGADTARFGRGLAYADSGECKLWRDAYLLNSPSEAVDAEFVSWAAAHWPELEKRMSTGQAHWLEFGAEHLAARDYGALYWPRSIFGDYLERQAEQVLAKLVEGGVRVEKRSAIATSMAKQGNTIRITLQSGEALIVDSVDVATGGPSNQRYGADAGSTAFTRLYGNEHAIECAISQGECTVTCLGANAAMLDVLRFLQSVMPEQDIRMQVITTTDSLPEPMIPVRPRQRPVEPVFTQRYDTAAEFIHAVDDQMEQFRESGASMYELRRGYYEALGSGQLSHLIASVDERRKVMPLLARRFLRGTHDSIADFERLRAAGQIELVFGRVESVHARQPYENDIRLKTAEGSIQKTTVPVVINTSGSGGQLAFDLVTSEMIRHGWLQLDESRQGIVVGSRLESNMPNVRYLSPVVTEIGTDVLAFPLYDVAALKKSVERASA